MRDPAYMQRLLLVVIVLSAKSYRTWVVCERVMNSDEEFPKAIAGRTTSAKPSDCTPDRSIDIMTLSISGTQQCLSV